MTRNLSNRVEAIAPILDPNLQQQLLTILDICLTDTRQGWKMMPDGRYRRRRHRAEDEDAAAGTHRTLMDLVRTSSSQI
ncbi:MAG: hypothetical protein R2873_19245 [Caldilineaceae bacterium]